MGMVWTPLALVTTTFDARSSGYINCPTPAAVEWSHFSLRARVNCSGRNEYPTKMSVSPISSSMCS